MYTRAGILAMITVALSGCGSSSTTPTPRATATPAATALPTPKSADLQMLLDTDGRGSGSKTMNEHIFTAPRGYFRLTYQYHCAKSAGYGPNTFALFSNLEGAPLADPGEAALSGRGTIMHSTSQGKSVILAVIADTSCTYHLHIVG